QAVVLARDQPMLPSHAANRDLIERIAKTAAASSRPCRSSTRTAGSPAKRVSHRFIERTRTRRVLVSDFCDDPDGEQLGEVDHNPVRHCPIWLEAVDDTRAPWTNHRRIGCAKALLRSTRAPRGSAVLSSLVRRC